jgi:hypothetical protein
MIAECEKYRGLRSFCLSNGTCSCLWVRLERVQTKEGRKGKGEVHGIGTQERLLCEPQRQRGKWMINSTCIMEYFDKKKKLSTLLPYLNVFHL